MKTKTIFSNYSLSGAVCAGTLLLAAGASAQNLFVSNYSGQTIYEYTPGGTQSTFATGMNYPVGIAFNSAGDLFVANCANNAIPASGNITEIMPNGTPSIFASGLDPQALAFNSSGDLFEGEYRSGVINEFSHNGIQSTFATGLSFPLVMAIDSSGDLFVGGGYGTGNGVITKITPGGTESVFASGLSFPGGMAFNSAGDLFVTQQGYGTISEFTPGGVESTYATLSYSLNGLAFNSAGDLFVAASTGPIIELPHGGGQSVFATESGIPAQLAFQPVPEPPVMALAGIGVAAFFARRRK
jgi:hypothetical protein